MKKGGDFYEKYSNINDDKSDNFFRYGADKSISCAGEKNIGKG
jgi:hypothetical protein